MHVDMRNGAKEIGLAKLKPFDGSRDKVRDFLQDCGLYIEVNEDVYNTPLKKIAFVFSLMDSKEALLWKRQFLQSITKDGRKQWPTLVEFADKIQEEFK